MPSPRRFLSGGIYCLKSYFREKRVEIASLRLNSLYEHRRKRRSGGRPSYTIILPASSFGLVVRSDPLGECLKVKI